MSTGQNKRVEIRAILADKHLRRAIMVPAIQAIQAREGIETTREQAERAYDKVANEKNPSENRMISIDTLTVLD